MGVSRALARVLPAANLPLQALGWEKARMGARRNRPRNGLELSELVAA